MGITICFRRIPFNAFISINFLEASANALSFAAHTTLSKKHGEISRLKLRGISLNLLKDPFHFVDCSYPKIIPDKC